MKLPRAAVLLFLAPLLFAACDDKKGPSPKEKAERAAAGEVDLEGGTKHDPPIEIDAVKAGHFYCDMGTVHYSRPDEGDNTCPVCGMELTEKK